MSLGKKIVQQLIRRVKHNQRILNGRRDAVGELLAVLLASGMTQQEIAEELGINQSSVSKYLNNLSTPREETMVALVLLAKKWAA